MIVDGDIASPFTALAARCDTQSIVYTNQTLFLYPEKLHVYPSQTL